eukprot:CAMPEP_0201569218 /NCGR_PEP_ID=MMETSP0190_2-20130828/10782_1 /ASSEMBLY_ACC=CAM_ASM_000263 /TAXON_ID=37353 /ORGANISM="Rosalina sp." /LENGTH=86 /DNA_ID=CAMNT_0047991301 /DNA_START=107 /DNA_END=363 /DNA_ORIENTATION=-
MTLGLVALELELFDIANSVKPEISGTDGLLCSPFISNANEVLGVFKLDVFGVVCISTEHLGVSLVIVVTVCAITSPDFVILFSDLV